MTRDTERERDCWIGDGVNGRGDIGGEDLCAAEFFVAPVGGEPYFAKGAIFREDDL